MKKRKLFVLGLVGTILLSPMSVYALSKNETVYTSLNMEGKVIHSSVTNHLFVNEKIELEDETELNNILNINGKETFQFVDHTLKWDANGKDIFYQGQIEKEMPIDIQIEYYLDGEKRNPNEMVGQKGKVQIQFHFQNKLANEVLIDGQKETVYTPFVVTLGMILNNQNNKNIEIENGKWVDSGSRSMVIGLATPGLYESLGIESLEQLNRITISYETTKFSLGTIYMVATPKLLEEKDLNVFEKLNTFSSSMKTLQHSMNQIEEGAKKLEVGSFNVMNGSKEISANLEVALSSITQLKNGSIELKQGIDNTIDALQVVEQNLKNKDMKGSILKLQELKNANNSAMTGLVTKTGMTREELEAFYQSALKEYTGDNEQYVMLKSTYEMIYLLSMNNSAIDNTISSLTEISNSVDTLLANLKSVLNELQVGTTAMSEGLTVLEAGINQLSAGANTLFHGSNELYQGTVTLNSGIGKLNREGIYPLYQYSNMIHGYSNKVEAMINLSHTYHGYATNSADETIFVYTIKSSKKL